MYNYIYVKFCYKIASLGLSRNHYKSTIHSTFLCEKKDLQFVPKTWTSLHWHFLRLSKLLSDGCLM